MSIPTPGQLARPAALCQAPVPADVASSTRLKASLANNPPAGYKINSRRLVCVQGKQQQLGRPPRASVPAFGGWEGGAQPDYSLDFTKIRAARMQRRSKALSWSSFVGNANAAVEQPPPGADEDRHQWSSAASEGDDDHLERRRRHPRPRHRRLRSDAADDRDDRQPIRPGRADPKERSKFKGYLFGCVGGLW